MKIFEIDLTAESFGPVDRAGYSIYKFNTVLVYWDNISDRVFLGCVVIIPIGFESSRNRTGTRFSIDQIEGF